MNEVRISQGNLNKIEVKPKKTQGKIFKKNFIQINYEYHEI